MSKSTPNEAIPDEGSGHFGLQASGLPSIELYTSTIGEIGDPLLFDPTGRNRSQKSILMRDPDCYRIMRFDFDNGDTLAARFEPQKIPSGTLLRNVHTAFRMNGRKLEKIESLHFHLFEEAVKANLLYLSSPQFSTEKVLEASRRKLELLRQLSDRNTEAKSKEVLQDEPRKQGRVSVQAVVELDLDGRKLDGTLTDLSETGLQLHCPEGLPVGSVVEFKIPWQNHAITFSGSGRVIWARYFEDSDVKMFYGIAVTSWQDKTGPEIVELLLSN